MDFVTEPIYKADVLLDTNETFRRAVEMTKKYRVKTVDAVRKKIVLNATYLYTFFIYVTWIKEIVITVTSVSDKVSTIEVYGKPALSPHHLFLTSLFYSRKIDRKTFVEEIANTFKGCLAKSVQVDFRPKGRLDSIIFYLLEALSILFLAHILASRFLLGKSLISISSWITMTLFLLAQAVLIVWFTRDCYRSPYVSLSAKPRWISFIAATGFVGVGFYFFMVHGRKERGYEEGTVLSR